MTSPAQQAVFDAASLLAKTEYDANKALLAKVTTFLTDVAGIRDGLGFPSSYPSPLVAAVNMITQNTVFYRDQDLPQRITAYEDAQAAATQPTATPPASA